MSLTGRPLVARTGTEEFLSEILDEVRLLRSLLEQGAQAAPSPVQTASGEKLNIKVAATGGKKPAAKPPAKKRSTRK